MTVEPRPGADQPLWSGRFSGQPAAEAHALGRSIDVDLRLIDEDVRAGVAHVAAMSAAGLLDTGEAERLRQALRWVAAEAARGTLVVDDADEDVHSVVERAVTQRLGDLGARLHAGRSRNDLVVTDLRLWLLDSWTQIDAALVGLVDGLVTQAREHAATLMPGTTHARPAQPVTLGHHLLAHCWAFIRDLDRLDDWARRTRVSPLGAGAIATSTLGLDPKIAADLLGFDRAFANSIDAVSDRDFAIESCGVAAICASHTSRLAADLLRWSDPALGWAEFDEAFSTGSSMMPQKRNPDTAELVRAKGARVVGDLVAVLALLQGLPLGYHRDLQEDKEPVFDAVETLLSVVPAIDGAVRTIRFDVGALRGACDDPGLYATDLAEALVRAGVPFRQAHRRTGALFRDLAAEGRDPSDLTMDEWVSFGVPGGGDMLDPDRSVGARSGSGGPTQASVLVQADGIDELLRERRSPPR
jgi:argininosuccinate lyase